MLIQDVFYRLQVAEEQQEVPHGRQVQTVHEVGVCLLMMSIFQTRKQKRKQKQTTTSPEDDSADSEAASAVTNADGSYAELEFVATVTKLSLA